jgi:hypothetical protein
MFGEASIPVLVVPIRETSQDGLEVSDLATNIGLSFGTDGRSSLTCSLNTLYGSGSRRNPCSATVHQAPIRLRRTEPSCFSSHH